MSNDPVLNSSTSTWCPSRCPSPASSGLTASAAARNARYGRVSPRGGGSGRASAGTAGCTIAAANASRGTTHNALGHHADSPVDGSSVSVKPTSARFVASIPASRNSAGTRASRATAATRTTIPVSAVTSRANAISLAMVAGSEPSRTCAGCSTTPHSRLAAASPTTVASSIPPPSRRVYGRVTGTAPASRSE